MITKKIIHIIIFFNGLVLIFASDELQATPILNYYIYLIIIYNNYYIKNVEKNNNYI